MMNAVAMLDPFVPRPYRVIRRAREAPDTVTLEIAPVAGETPQFRPGQFNMLYAFGVGEIAISMSGNAAERSCFVHTIRAVGAVSGAITALNAGNVLGLRGPFGTSWPLEEAQGRDVVIVAGGLGLAPLRPAMYHLLGHRARYRRVILLIGMRNPGEILYRRQVEQWRENLDVEVEVTVDRADGTWHGNVGVVPALVGRMPFDPAAAIAMVCGPEIMMRFTVSALSDAGVGLDRIYVSMERNMKCAIGLCGHCQFGPDFICKDGPVMRMDRIARASAVKEI
jgi:NAD(P)H-flavin reductase